MTRGIKRSDIELRCVAAVSPGTSGGTGIDAQEQLSALAKKLSPAAFLCVDSLFTAEPCRLGCSIQLSDAGLHPRASHPVCAEQIGVPIIAIGVPTVMEARYGAKTVTVTPKDIDAIVKRVSQILSLAINKALQPALRVGELEFLTN